MRSRIVHILTAAVLFLLPWQTRWIFSSPTLNGGEWEYGKVSLYATEILVLVAFLLRGRLEIPNTARRLVVPAAFLSFVLVLSAAFGADPILSVSLLIHPLAALLFFFLLLDTRTSTGLVVKSFLLGLVAPAALGWFQALSGWSPASTLLGLSEHLATTPGVAVVESGTMRWLRAYGSFSHPNVFGGFLAVAIVVVAWQLYKGRREDRRLPLTLFVLFLSTLVVTFSRSAWLAAGMAAAVGSGCVLWFRKALPRDALPFIALSLATLLVTAGIFWQPLFTRFDSSARLEAKSLEERQSQYTALDNVSRRNPLTGVGYGAYTLALSEAFPGFASWSYQPIHNVPLLILSEIGLLGFLCAFFFVLRIDQLNWRRRQATRGIFALTLGTALLTVALFDHYLWSSWPGLALVALVLALKVKWLVEAES